MNKLTTFFIICVGFLSFSLGATLQGKAEEKGFAGIIPFSTTSNRIGFLDQNNGRVYMYDENISHCVFVGQIHGLGENIQVIAQPQDNTISNPSNL